MSALLNRTMDRFLFQDADVRLGAALSQFPLGDTRRADLVVVKVENWLPCWPVIDSKIKSEDFDKAKRETQCYTICGLTKTSYKFPYCFGLPYCRTKNGLIDAYHCWSEITYC